LDILGSIKVHASNDMKKSLEYEGGRSPIALAREYAEHGKSMPRKRLSKKFWTSG
jgi:hypothetical protein